ncbi:MAG TPA: hypothetical protein VF230_01000 [Acidimicrobiales bacterium]
MTGRSLRWGLVAGAGIAAFYVGVLTLSADWQHLRDQTRQDWWLLVPIVAGFGTQVALMVELRRRHRAHHLGATTGTGTSASAVGMVACCAHHVAELVPLLGATGLAAFLFDWRVPFMLAGIAINAVAISIAARRLHQLNTHDRQGEMTACAA